MGAVEERDEAFGHLPGAGKEEPTGISDHGSSWRCGAGATSQSCCGVLKLEERKEFLGDCGRSSIRRIAQALGRSPSRISREI